jgi:hypothetical protein
MRRIKEVGGRSLLDANYAWAEAWIRAMKLEKHLTSGTIRKHKGALSNVFDWVVRAHPACLGINPLDQLPYGYSGYDEYTRHALLEEGIEIPGDCERNRRIDVVEEARIIEVLQRQAEAAPTLEQRAEAEGLSLMLNSGCRRQRAPGCRDCSLMFSRKPVLRICISTISGMKRCVAGLSRYPG